MSIPEFGGRVTVEYAFDDAAALPKNCCCNTGGKVESCAVLLSDGSKFSGINSGVSLS